MASVRKAFTIMEMMVVIIIISIIAAFAIPSYERTMDKSRERIVILNLLSIRSAMDIWLAKRSNNYPAAVWNSLGEINTELGINLIDTDATYSCTWTGPPPDDWGCTGNLAGPWQIHFHRGHVGNQLHCTNGACPSCPDQPGNCG